MSDGFLVIRTIRGRQYLYRERRWRENGRVRSSSEYLGAIDPAGQVRAVGASKRRSRTSAVHSVAMNIFGVEDEYGRRVDSLWNRFVNKEKEREKSARKSAPDDGGEAETSLSVGGNDEATASKPQSDADPSANSESQTDEG
jgi:hypothetical protein